METTIQRLTKILEEHEWNKLLNEKVGLGIDRSTNLKEDLGMDSLDRAEFIYYTEKELGVTIPDEIREEFSTVGDYADYIDNNKKK